jgi:preprotein translocase SecE subunit
MLNFFYESLETVQKIKYPTQKEFIQLTLGIFGLVIVAAIFFAGVDTLFFSLSKILYSALR